MKKAIISLFIFALTILNAQAKDYSSYCSTKSADKTFLGTIGSITGTNAIKRNIIESEIQTALKKKTGAKFDVKADNFFGLSPMTGVFKGLKLSANDLTYNGLYISSIDAQTLCDYNEVKYEDNKLSFVENAVMEFSAEINEAGLNKIMTQSQFGKIIEKMNNDKKISSVMKIQSNNVKISDDKLIFNYNVSLLPKNGNILSHIPINLNNINLAFSSGLAVKDGKIQLLDFGLNNNQLNYGFLLPLVNKFNPTTWELDSKKELITNGQLEINDVKIQNSKIQIKGIIIAKADN